MQEVRPRLVGLPEEEVPGEASRVEKRACRDEPGRGADLVQALNLATGSLGTQEDSESAYPPLASASLSVQ